jgi:hypothetical protein
MIRTLPLSINGTFQEVPLKDDHSLGELLNLLRDQYTTDTCCISSIKVDGDEISEAAEKALAPLQLSDLHSIEIMTSHPRELVQQTLQSVIEFCEPLIARATLAGEAFRSAEHPSTELASLVDGIGVFSDALNGAKQIMKVGTGSIPRLDLLEADLASIMKDVVTYYEQDQTQYVAELLCDHLVKNIREWQTAGLPELMRSRDS